jgi:hypothetical protein
MREHRKEVLTDNTTPAKLWEIKNLNEQITEQFEDVIEGLGHKDNHCWLAKPLAHVLE